MGVCERVNEACSIKHFEGSSRVEKHYVRTSPFIIHYAGLWECPIEQIKALLHLALAQKKMYIKNVNFSFLDWIFDSMYKGNVIILRMMKFIIAVIW